MEVNIYLSAVSQQQYVARRTDNPKVIELSLLTMEKTIGFVTHLKT